MTDRLTWISTKKIYISGSYLSIANYIPTQINIQTGIKTDTRWWQVIKFFTWHPYRIFANLFIDGFIRRVIKRFLNEYLESQSVFLEIGCGDMEFRKYLPDSLTYNAIDISLSEFHLKRVLKEKRVNICLASATNIPLPSNSVSLVVSSECFGHIENVEDALIEIHRVANPGAKLICSISNSFCYKYQKKGKHPNQLHLWSYQSFINLMESIGYKMIKGSMCGYWIPMPKWLGHISFHLPISSKEEKFNTNFFFVFEIIK